MQRRDGSTAVRFGCELFELELERCGAGPVRWRVSARNAATGRLELGASGSRPGLYDGARAAVRALASAGLARGVDESELVAALITPFHR